jgi:hypothetical protein
VLSGTILRFAERQMQDRGLNEALLGAHEAGLEFRLCRLVRPTP